MREIILQTNDHNSETSKNLKSLRTQRRKLAKGIYLLPSLLTACALFSGFYSIVFTVKTMADGEFIFHVAGYAIIIATFLDGIDGRVARLLNAESEFGVQFDSIADMVSFGVAPAVLAYAYALAPLSKWGWMGAFMFLACAGIRLARFNVITNEVPSRKYFKGLSSPVAAGGIALMVLLDVKWPGQSFHIAALVYTVILSLLMVSNVRFRSFKDFDFHKKQPIALFMAFMLLVVLIFSFRENTLFFMFITYMAWGLIEEFILFRRRRKSDPSTPFLPFGDR